MKYLLLSIIFVSLSGCVSYQTSSGTKYAFALDCTSNIGLDLNGSNASINCGSY